MAVRDIFDNIKSFKLATSFILNLGKQKLTKFKTSPNWKKNTRIELQFVYLLLCPHN